MEIFLIVVYSNFYLSQKCSPITSNGHKVRFGSDHSRIPFTIISTRCQLITMETQLASINYSQSPRNLSRRQRMSQPMSGKGAF